MNVEPKKTVAQQESEFGILYRDEPTKCCQLRKVEPLMEALEPFEIWFTGLRREQSPTRKNLRKAEDHRLPSGKTVLKVSPLADWTWAQVWEYTGANRLELPSAIRSRLREHRLRALHRLAGRSKQSTLRPVGWQESWSAGFTRFRNGHNDSSSPRIFHCACRRADRNWRRKLYRSRTSAARGASRR